MARGDQLEALHPAFGPAADHRRSGVGDPAFHVADHGNGPEGFNSARALGGKRRCRRLACRGYQARGHRRDPRWAQGESPRAPGRLPAEPRVSLHHRFGGDQDRVRRAGEGRGQGRRGAGNGRGGEPQAPGGGSEDGGDAGAGRAALPVQHPGEHRSPDRGRPTAREQDAEKPHRVVARLDARDARERRDTGAGAAGGAPLPRDPEGAHGRPPAGGNQRRGGPVFGRLSADGAAIAGRERDQARPGAEAGRRRAEGGGRSGTRQAGSERGRHRRGVRPRRDRGNGDRLQQHPRAPQAHLRPASRAAHRREFADWHPCQRRRTLQDCMTPRAVIADDEALMREQLRARLGEVWPELEIAAEARNGAEAVELVAAERPDVVFLDIRMPAKSGIEAAREIAALPRESRVPEIVFVTAYDQYAIDAFEQGVIDYVLKPAERERLALTVERIRKRLAAPTDNAQGALQQALERLAGKLEAPSHLRWIQASVGPQIQMIPVEEVLLFISDEKYTRVQTAQQEALIRTPIRELIAALDPAQFWQIHRSTLINARAIAGISRDERGRQLVSIKGRPEKLEVSRSYAHLFKGM